MFGHCLIFFYQNARNTIFQYVYEGIQYIIKHMELHMND